MFDGKMLAELAREGMMITQVYGMTETCGDGIINYAQDEKHIRSAGKPDDHCEYKIAEDGELCSRGGCVMLGYYKDPAATAEVVDADGWLHTGDLARADEEGYYYITGRKKNLIILDSGENVSPEELESLLAKCPAVKECVVKEKGQEDLCRHLLRGSKAGGSAGVHHRHQPHPAAVSADERRGVQHRAAAPYRHRQALLRK